MKSGDLGCGPIHRVHPAKPRPLRHLRVVVSENGEALVEVYMPAAPVAARLPALAGGVPATVADLDAAFACRDPEGRARGPSPPSTRCWRGRPASAPGRGSTPRSSTSGPPSSASPGRAAP